MAENSHFGSFAPALRSDQKEARQTHLATVALESARSLIWVPNATRSRHFPQRVKRLSNRMRSVLASVAHKRAAESEEQKWLGENSDLLGSQLAGLQELRDGLTRTAHVRRTNGDVVPRPLVIAEDLLFSLDYRFEETGFVTFLHSFQTATVLRMEELWELIPAMQLVLLERVADIAELNAGKNSETVKELAA